MSASGITDYEDAVERIYRDYIEGSDAATAGEIQAAILSQDDGTTRMTSDRAQQIADALPNSDSVISDLDRDGGIPDDSKIEDAVRQSSDFDLGADTVADDVADRVFTEQDLNETVRDLTDDGEAVFAEDVERRISNVDKDLVGVSTDQASDIASTAVGAPSQSEVADAQQDVVEFDAGITPRDAVGDDVTEIDGVGDATADQSLGAIRDDSGEIETVISANEDAGRAVADEIGASYTSPSEVSDGFELEQSRGSARLQYDSETVRTFDV